MASKALAEGMLAERRHNSFRSASRPTGTMTQIITLPLILLSKRRCSRFAVLVWVAGLFNCGRRLSASTMGYNNEKVGWCHLKAI